MLSDGNCFCGDFVLDSVNMSSSEEDSKLDHTYEKQIFSDPYYKDLNVEKSLKKIDISN